MPLWMGERLEVMDFAKRGSRWLPSWVQQQDATDVNRIMPRPFQAWACENDLLWTSLTASVT